MHIHLLDHLIIGADNAPFSFADNRIMQEIRDRISFPSSS